jgi:hypothetical protein
MPRTPSATPACGRREALAVEVEHIVAAIGKGLLSPALSTRLQAAEQELATLSSAEFSRCPAASPYLKPNSIKSGSPSAVNTHVDDPAGRTEFSTQPRAGGDTTPKASDVT